MSTLHLDTPVLDILKQCTITGSNVQMPQMDRSLYNKVNKALELIGGKWNRSAKAHVFAEDPAEAIQNAITFGEVVDQKKLTQFFPTPPDIADRMVTEAAILPHHTVLEPSAGEGAIIEAIMDQCPTRLSIGVCEMDAKRQQLLLRKYGSVINWLGSDFLTVPTTMFFDRIIMNPPFRHGQDVDHITRAFNMLADGGRVVAIAAPGWTFRTEKKYTAFRDLVEAHGSFEALPEGTFRSAGTDIRTTFITLDR